MIRINRPALPSALASRLQAETTSLGNTVEPRQQAARKRWRTTRQTIHQPLFDVLAGAAAGRQRCMYCGDNLGSDIDHFEPIARNPLRTFDWRNHLLACSTCNSQFKRDRFPVDQNGQPLLIDPTTEDPFDHLRWTWIGEYVPLTDKGAATIETCGLNRPILVNGRDHARKVVIIALKSWWEARQAGDAETMSAAALTIRQQPCADVSQAMLRHAILPGADVIFFQVPKILELLRMPDVRDALLSP
jgi:HNH endonuclease